MGFFRQRKANVPFDWSEMPVEVEINVTPYTSGLNWNAHAKASCTPPSGLKLVLEEYLPFGSPEEGRVWAEQRAQELATELKRRAVRDAQAIRIRKTL